MSICPSQTQLFCQIRDFTATAARKPKPSVKSSVAAAFNDTKDGGKGALEAAFHGHKKKVFRAIPKIDNPQTTKQNPKGDESLGCTKVTAAWLGISRAKRRMAITNGCTTSSIFSNFCRNQTLSIWKLGCGCCVAYIGRK